MARDQNENDEEEFRKPKKSDFPSSAPPSGLKSHPAIERKLNKQLEKSKFIDVKIRKEENEKKAVKFVAKESKVDQALYYDEKVAPMLDEITRALSCGTRSSTRVLARTIYALKVRGSNLTSVCKLVFKITRHDANDVLFMEGNLLDLVLEAVACASPLEHAEACIYGYGALKFLTMNSHLVTRLLHRGVLELLVLHMKLIATQKEDSGSVPEQTGYALVQLTGTLRHVSSCDKAFKLLLVTGAVEQVCKLFIVFHKDAEVTANIVRIL
ncbi:Armadillo repeat-containing protein 2, partial [Armadillidium vulgare]